MSANDNYKKLSTGMAGLDALLYGGIHTHKGEEGRNGILVLTRGQHGVNKIHLAMQICEGLYNSSLDEIEKWRGVMEEYTYAALYKREKDEKLLGKTVCEIISSIITSGEKTNKEAEISQWKQRKEQTENKYDIWYKNIGSKILRNAVKNIFLEEDTKHIAHDNLKWFVSRYVKNKRESISNNDISNILKNEMVLGKKGITNETIDQVYENKIGYPQLLFISLNKDDNLLKSSYYDFYIQRLIRNIRNGTSGEEVRLSLYLLRSMLWNRGTCLKHKWMENEDILELYELPSITGRKSDKIGNKKDLFREHIKSGFLYYNGRTHGLHIRHQKGAEDTGDMLLCKLDIPDDYRVRIIGKDTLNSGNKTADGLTTFQNMMRLLDKYNKKDFDFIMIDGLSRLTQAEIAQCPFTALADRLRSMCTVGIVTADEKLLQSDINVDIVMDMAIRQSERPDHLYTAIKISKCLYQKNAYGWHRYKMRNAGIEVIPSIHYQMVQRFLIDDAVTDAVLPIDEFPYPYWLNENEKVYEDKDINKAITVYGSSLIKSKTDYVAKIVKPQGVLHGILLDDLDGLIANTQFEIKDNQHVFFVCLDKERSEFYYRYKDLIDNIFMNDCKINLKRVHLFCYQPGYSHADEFLWALDRQVRAIENIARNGDKTMLGYHFSHVVMIMGDINYIHYGYPCLSAEQLLLPALATYTKRHHMTNYLYATLNNGIIGQIETDLYKKELETIMQMKRYTNFVDVKAQKNSWDDYYSCDIIRDCLDL